MAQAASQPSGNAQTRLNKYGYNCIAKHIGMAVMISAPLFIGAGTFQWGWAWVYSAVTLIGWVILSYVLIRVNPELLNERGRPAKSQTGTKRWDWIIMSIYSVLLLLLPLVAGVDTRNSWSVPTSDVLKGVGIVMLAFSFIPLTWSMAVNRFFEPTVRIQASRGHRVVDAGPYRYVRHPGYVAVILQFIVVPLSLGTLVAWIPALIGAGLFVYRTAKEDQTLIAELPGYAAFAQHTRYRLLPGVW